MPGLEQCSRKEQKDFFTKPEEDTQAKMSMQYQHLTRNLLNLVILTFFDLEANKYALEFVVS